MFRCIVPWKDMARCLMERITNSTLWPCFYSYVRVDLAKKKISLSNMHIKKCHNTLSQSKDRNKPSFKSGYLIKMQVAFSLCVLKLDIWWCPKALLTEEFKAYSNNKALLLSLNPAGKCCLTKFFFKKRFSVMNYSRDLECIKYR